MFHSETTLLYTNGQIIMGILKNGCGKMAKLSGNGDTYIAVSFGDLGLSVGGNISATNQH